ncbi:GNAT family N-acetyltransferase [Aquibium sp. ELW1220]|uniref:GNAT family N-acetyltransferase n=1 Tax=Aquibium sp. ELW1220 TaxID=2976766 RepID=UPI0025B13B68|nr:GNAT family N-acetyltransferase [Aquibium sp. ELW1220]MDN2580000.1 GNAT family N-acetyltransferase [Aquibium sp. ELW1220]
MSLIAVRPASRDDLPAIAAIYGHAVRTGTASYELDPPSEADMASRFDTLLAGSYPYFVAECPDGVLGYAYAGPFRPRRAYRFMVEDSIYLAPAAQGRGTGRLLLSALIEECTRLGFRQMVAVIGDGKRNQASVRLHESTGFRHAGLLEGSGYKHGRWLDTVFMQLSLNGGTASPPDPLSLPERSFAPGK